jgi:hypothetical protein
VSTPPNLALKREDLRDAKGEWVEKLTRALGAFGTQTQDAFDRNISILANLNATRKVLDITTKDDWIAPTLLNSWVNYGTPPNSALAGYRKRNGRIEIRGLLKSGTPPSTVFALPVAHRPAEDTRLAITASSYVFGAFRVDSGGTADIRTGSTTWTDITCSFPAGDPSPVPNPIFPVVFKHGLKGTAKPMMVIALDVLDVTASASGQHVSTTVSWQPSGDSVRIEDLPGLEPNRHYRVTFLVLGE